MKNKNIICLLGITIALMGNCFNLKAQSLGLNNASPDNSSILDAAATDRGILIPRMTTAQRIAIVSPAKSLLVFDTSINLFYYNAGTSAAPNWIALDNGWHGSSSRIKILPTDFLSNQSGRENSFTYKETSTNKGVTPGFNGNYLFAFIAIPTGFKATHVKIYGAAKDVYTVYESDITNGTWGTLKGSATIGTEIDITDVISTTTNFLALEILTNSENDLVYGGYVTIAAQ